LKLLCAADLHIGRRPARLPPAWGGGRISAAAAWDGLVDCALERRVDAVLLAGDVVDQDNRYFEAFGPLGRGVLRLKEAGIAVVAVAGNHDHHTLHEVAAQVGHDHLVVLGRGGRWERWTLRDDNGAARLHVDGWSFPAAHHHDDPVADYRLESAADGAPVVGLLHCDLDSTETRYAPVRSDALAAAPVAAWILGHVHGPRLAEAPGRPPILYPGSLLALDLRETGRRGAWLVEVAPDRAPSFEHLPLSRVRYDTVPVDVDGLNDFDAVRARVGSTLQDRLARVVEEGIGPLEVVVARARLEGRTALHARLESLLANLGDLELADRQGVRLVVERVEVHTAPALDLADLARGSDAPARLARLLLALDRAEDAGRSADPDRLLDVDRSADPDRLFDVDRSAGVDQPADLDLLADPVLAQAGMPELVAAAVRVAAGVAARPHYAGLDRDPAGDDAVAPAGRSWGDGNPEGVARGVLRRQASRLLDELVRQKAVL
jgi:DNA repair protein SbcD/Mre11